MNVVAFLAKYAVVGRILDHLKLTFVAAKLPPPGVAFQELFLVADPSALPKSLALLRRAFGPEKRA